MTTVTDNECHEDDCVDVTFGLSGRTTCNPCSIVWLIGLDETDLKTAPKKDPHGRARNAQFPLLLVKVREK